MNAIDAIPPGPLERHVFLAALLKWFGGYPVNYMDDTFQEVMLMDRQELQKETALHLKSMMLRNLQHAAKVVVVP